MDAAFPGQIPLSKVNFNAIYDYEFSTNFKILQNHFVKIKCDKVVPTDRLIKAKYQDNLEFMQWMKRFFEMEYSGTEYDAKARRKECKVEYAGDKSSAGSKPSKPATSSTAASTSTSTTSAKPTTTTQTTGRASMMPGTGTSTRPVRQSMMPTTHVRTATASSATRPGAKPTSADSAKVDELTKRCAELTIEVAKSETTREFYYDKLREIEQLLASLVPEEETVTGLRDKVNAILFSDESRSA
jgi:RP/EB family microtubule-associated protein